MTTTPRATSPLTSTIVTALMLFSMFFGAGNLIFPALLGAQAGTNFTPAIIGFIATGVIVPILAVIALAVTGRDLQDFANRGGRIFGMVFPALVYLSIGALYTLPPHRHRQLRHRHRTQLRRQRHRPPSSFSPPSSLVSPSP